MPELNSSAVVAEVESLRAAWQSGDPRDTELRRRCELGLSRLRQVFRSAPALFNSATVETLRTISEALRTAPAPTQQSPQEVLKSTFGYQSFRAGQEEIISAVMSGRDCIGVM